MGFFKPFLHNFLFWRSKRLKRVRTKEKKKIKLQLILSKLFKIIYRWQCESKETSQNLCKLWVFSSTVLSISPKDLDIQTFS